MPYSQGHLIEAEIKTVARYSLPCITCAVFLDIFMGFKSASMDKIANPACFLKQQCDASTSDC